MGESLISWAAWTTATIGLGAYLLFIALTPGHAGAPILQPGDLTDGHHQIALACSACHRPDKNLHTEACLTCHKQELDAMDDSHPASKFTDPRQAHRLQAINVMQCTTCHVEHHTPRTSATGLTLPQDYCAFCHADIAQERPTHTGEPFKNCLTAGCHNFHDNRALHEDFLSKHLGEDDHKTPTEPLRRFGAEYFSVSGSVPEPDAPADQLTPAAVAEWKLSLHARRGVNCSDCHRPRENTAAWVVKPDHAAACSHCHTEQIAGFQAGKHGMKQSCGLGALSPSEARLSMKPQAAARNLDCASCHDTHRVDVVFAASRACLSCHDDKHSLAFETSPHGQLWAKAESWKIPPDESVSCATCHLPRGSRGTEVTVNHNQNGNLRPADKMIASACIRCHGVPFSLAALSDPEQIRTNFALDSSPAPRSLKWILKRPHKTAKGPAASP